MENKKNIILNNRSLVTQEIREENKKYHSPASESVFQ
jgi:hypothetical protein